MNWFRVFKRLIGRFWTELGFGSKFISWIESMQVIAGKLFENSHGLWWNRLVLRTSKEYRAAVPTPIYCDEYLKSRLFTTLDDIFAGTAELGGKQADGGWLCKPESPVEGLAFITAMLDDDSVTLTEGIDFTIHPEGILFFTDPSELFSKVTRVISGDVHTYLYMVGWARKAAGNDAVEGFYGKELGKYAEDVWRLHVTGATVYNIKALISDIAGAVLSDVDGFVSSILYEQDYTHVLVTNSLGITSIISGMSSLDLAVSVGDTVSKGQVVLGYMKYYTGTSGVSSTDIPGIRVMTDYGELTAANTDDTPIVVTTAGTRCIPLLPSGAIRTAYYAECDRNAADPACPRFDSWESLGDSVNPFEVVTHYLRRGRSCYMCINAYDAKAIPAAVSMINDCMPCGSSVTLFIKSSQEAELDTALLNTAKFTADVHNSVISVCETPLAIEVMTRVKEIL